MISNAGKFEVSVGGMVLLVAATIVTTAAVFLLGIWVGKGVAEQRFAAESHGIRKPVGSAAGTPKSGEVDVTFWDRIGRGDSARVGEAAAATPEPTETEEPVRVQPEATPPPTRRGKQEKEERPTPTPAAAESEEDEGAFQVQVNALAEKARAEKLVRELAEKGYRAHISPAQVKKQTLYRVRVAGFASEDAAREAVTKLREQGYPRAFVAEGGR